MIREICRDETFLAQKAAPATADDLATAQDLLDTLLAHRESIDGLPPAAGLAANMIGVNKAIIAVNAGFLPIVMLNPKIVKRSGHYLAEEGCLSLPGERPADRYEEITVKYQDMDLKEHEQAFTGFVAETIQHEVDHCKGKLI